jgi:hypothetical protein
MAIRSPVMSKAVAVITDALSPGFFFPAWHKYYSRLFGESNLYVMTYKGFAQDFAGFGLGKVYELPTLYNDTVRAAEIAGFVSRLLETYDYVVRVDCDEFLVVDPREFSDLREYIEKLERPYVTAIGFDVIQDLATEPPLDMNRTLLAQRQFCFALTALNKTCITSIPLRWWNGFHYCTQPPALDKIYLLHMKRADLAMQEQWNEFMSGLVVDDEFIANYYRTPISQILQFHQHRFRLQTLDANAFFDRQSFNDLFLSSIKYDERSEIYDGPYVIEQHNVHIPEFLREFF